MRRPAIFSGDIPLEALLHDGRQSDAAMAIRRGSCRLLRNLGFSSLPELPLADGRRADLVALSGAGDIWIIEIKSSVEDFRADSKWTDYLAFCDRFYFAVAPDFPRDLLPGDVGVIIADRFAAEIIAQGPECRLAAARRKAMLLRYGRAAAIRLQMLADPMAGHR